MSVAREIGWRNFLLICAAVFAAGLVTNLHAQLQFPALSGPVVDAAGVLATADKTELDTLLRSNQQSTGPQIVVATVASLQGQDIRDFGNLLFRYWQLGDKQRNDGVLLLVAPHERKVSIEVGYGLEGTLTDALSKLIIENSILPRFRAGDLPGGIREGTRAILRVLSGEGEALISEGARRTGFPEEYDPVFALFMFLGMVIVLLLISQGLRGIGSAGSGPRRTARRVRGPDGGPWRTYRPRAGRGQAASAARPRKTVIPRAASGSAHHQPNRALAPSPTSSATER